MQLSSNRLTEIAKEGIITLAVGLALSLLTLIPDELVEPMGKLVAGVVIVLLGFLLLGLKIFYEDFNSYQELSDKVDKYVDKMPKTVSFNHYDRTIRISEDGTSTVTDQLKIENTSIVPRGVINIPSFCDIYRDPDLELLEDPSNFQIDRICIDSSEISSPANCYEREGILFGNGNPEERGNVRIPFSETGGLSPENERGSVKTVTIEYTVDGALRDATSGNGDALAYSAYHPTDKVEITILPPSEHDIRLKQIDHSSFGIEVKDINAGVIDNEEMARVGLPEVINNDRIEWKITDPKLSYRYFVHFNCQ